MGCMGFRPPRGSTTSGVTRPGIAGIVAGGGEVEWARRPSSRGPGAVGRRARLLEPRALAERGIRACDAGGTAPRGHRGRTARSSIQAQLDDCVGGQRRLLQLGLVAGSERLDLMNSAREAAAERIAGDHRAIDHDLRCRGRDPNQKLARARARKRPARARPAPALRDGQRRTGRAGRRRRAQESHHGDRAHQQAGGDHHPRRLGLPGSGHLDFIDRRAIDRHQRREPARHR